MRRLRRAKAPLPHISGIKIMPNFVKTHLLLFLSVQNFANQACEGGCGGGDPREEDDRRFKYRLVLDRLRELQSKDEGGRERTHDKDCEGGKYS